MRRSNPMTWKKRKDIGSRRHSHTFSLAMTCIEDKCERSGLYSNSTSHAKSYPHPCPLPKGEGERVLSFSPREKVPEGRMRGFTLAEVLITLGIIGVVAALTIPTLMQKADERETVSKVKKAYNTISNAVGLAVAENGAIDKWTVDATNSSTAATSAVNYLRPYLNIAKDCEIWGEGCIPNVVYKNLDGSNRLNWISTGYTSAKNFHKLTLNDGLAIMVAYSEDTNGNGIGLKILADINGEKAPNQMGVDLFQFVSIKEGKTFPYNDVSQELFVCDKTKKGDNCAAYIIENNNMDYLHE